MAYGGWLNLGGNEVLNHSRTTVYVKTLGCKVQSTGATCPTMPAAIGDGPYSTPVVDDAPWYDPADPHSAEFAGMLATSIEGLDTSAVSRAVNDLIGDGSAFGVQRRVARSIVVTGWLYGSSCCGVAAGLRWLNRALAEPPCINDPTGGCEGTDLCFLDCCPQPDESDPSSDPPTYDNVSRTLHQVALTDGPTVLSRWGNSCGSCGCSERLQIEYTLTAGDPWAYLDPDNVITDQPFGEDVACVEWSLDCLPCVSEQDITDPDCTPSPTPPSLPFVLAQCGECIPVSYGQVCIPISVETIPAWADAVPIITIKSGAVPRRNIIVSMFDNPANLDCADVGSCALSSQFAVSYLAANSTLVIDGSREVAYVDLGGGVLADANALLTGVGGPLVWPLLCCAPTCLCIEKPDDGDETATITVDLVVREA